VTIAAVAAMTGDLFVHERRSFPLDPGATLLAGFALLWEPELLAALDAVTAAAPFRHLVVPGGRRMSVAMTSCGAVGWWSDRSGYRYVDRDPETGRPWPPMPEAFANLAERAAAQGGFPGFAPDSCLINRYQPGTRLSLHQDKDERDFDAPIVSASLGLPAVFLWGGARRVDRPRRVPLEHGDVVVWGGQTRLNYHGVAPVGAGAHPLLGECRVNLTFRKAR
jgi:alkylated DNA repair protein (DNA oxidative demethylase)